jgi:ATP-dependent Clp protease protease subunit
MTNPIASGRIPFPPGDGEPEVPWPGSPMPGRPQPPGFPVPGRPQPPGGPEPGPLPPTRIWLDPDAGRQDELYERLLKQRIVLASGILNEPAATRLSAQLLTLDAEGDGPIRLELQNLQAELPAALTLMGVLDVARAQVQAFVSGEIGGPALGVLASCPRRLAYPNASFTLSEPRLRFSGTADAVSAREQQVRRMVDSLVYRIAEATGREADGIREDVRRGRVLTVAEAIGYGLVHDRAARRT